MSINELYLYFPKILSKRNGGKVSTIRVPVIYELTGTKEDAVRLASEIESEWEYTELNITERDEQLHVLEIEYQVKPQEVKDFLKSVTYRKELSPYKVG